MLGNLQSANANVLTPVEAAASARAPAQHASDAILLEARAYSQRLEMFAALELRDRLNEYLEPNFRARRMVDGFARYVETGTTTEPEYLNMRAAFTETKGRSNKVFSDVIASHIGKRHYDRSETMFRSYVSGSAQTDKGATLVNGEDGEDTTADAWQRTIKGAARHLEEHGWWKCRELAPQALVTKLKDRLMSALDVANPGKVELALKGADGAPMQLKVGSALAGSYPEMFELAADPLMLSIVQQYMGLPPIFNTPVAFLNSFVKSKNQRQLSDVAQLYHHDMHRLGFVKIFIYLTDVNEGSGPHTLVGKTHRKRPDHLWADGRHTDETIAEAGLAKDEVRITGKAGTVFLVDTSCLHKGSHPETEGRLMAQVQYANSLFGKPIANSDHKIEWATKATKSNTAMERSASLVRRYAQRAGVRFMQNYI